MERVRQRPLRADLARKPSKRELKNALGKMKNGKAGGSSGILPEMVKVACEDEEFLELLLALVHAVWEERRVLQEWADATLIPIPKKGNLSDCNNWRGIALLDVVGKVVARVIQERLQQLAEEELPEAQCGFRKGRSCSDMIFTVRQLVEKAIEHRAKKFLLFMDLKKAYDSVPRTALWYALKKLGVPDLVIDIIRSFHEGMKAKVSINGELLEEIEVRNGLRQGCTMAPVLFNLYACLVFERWSSQVASMEGVGTFLLHKFDQKLFRRYTRNACESQLMDGQFADDAVLLATTHGGAEQAMMSFVKVARAFGLTVSTQKTKMMVTGNDIKDEEMAPILVGNDLIECVESFTYLGSVVIPNARIDAEVDRRIACASRAFGALRQAVFKDKNLTITTKRRVYQACVLSVLLYGSECWVPLRRHLRRLNAFHHRCIRTILGITSRQQWELHITSQMTREQWGDVETVTTKVAKRRLEWLGHVARMPDHRLPKRALFGWLPQPRPPGGPQRRWRDVIRRDLKAVGVPEDQWYEAALSRASWRETCSQGLEQCNQQQLRLAQPQPQVQCPECKRYFRREGDRARHKCITERLKPVCEQRGAVQCPRCRRWFRSRGGLTVHRCSPQESPRPGPHTRTRPRSAPQPPHP